ncbi:hypothetical protein NP233_g7496 [Leucocoprinus birnbaumii]|uniref:Uncharacterized protein n=1 Tax=Leucocoprinus birnbaumii TaxID=56174 RepID=A0AAD5YPX6_9AGAR|nr:hypothetical protein NP233_g7496 [Leucocoprinus birnbaumii]
MLQEVKSVIIGIADLCCYTVAFGLYFQCTQTLLKARGKDRDIFMLAHTSFMMLCGLALVAMDAKPRLDSALLDTTELQGGGLASSAASSSRFSSTLVRSFAVMALDFTTLTYETLRFCVIWNVTSVKRTAGCVALLSGVLSLGYIAVQVATAVDIFQNVPGRKHHTYNLSLGAEILMLMPTVLMTTLIIIRINSVRSVVSDKNEHPEKTEADIKYTNLFAFLVESFSLFTATAIIEIAFTVLNHTQPGKATLGSLFVNATLSQVKTSFLSSHCYQTQGVMNGDPGGLTLARLLKIDNIPFRLLELDELSASRSQGGTFDIHGNSGQLGLKAVGLIAGFEKYAGPEGQPGLDRPEIDRQDLRKILLDSLDEGMITWGKQVVRVSEDPSSTPLTPKSSVELESGETETGFELQVLKLISLASTLKTLSSLIASVKERVFQFGQPGVALASQRNSDGSVRTYVQFKPDEDWSTTCGIDWTDVEGSRKALVNLKYSGMEALSKEFLIQNKCL